MRADDLRAVAEPTASSPSSTDPGAGSGRLARAIAWCAAAAVAVLAPAAYLRLHENPPVWIAHSDAFGYAWQIRLLGAAPTGDIGSRPGVAGVGAVLHGSHALPFEVGPIVLGLAAAVSLALACGAAVRMAFRLPPWTIAIFAAFVVFWGGTSRMGIGYLANLVSLVAMVLAAWITTMPSRGQFPVAASICMLASGVANPGFLPVYGTIAVAWAVVSVPRMLRDHRSGRSWIVAEPVQLLIAIVAGSLGTAVVLFVLMRLHPGDIANFQIDEFSRRLSLAARLIFSPLSVALTVAGGVVAWFSRSGRPSREMGRLGVSWSGVALAGAALTLVVSSFPGQRALLAFLPMPVAMGFAASGGVGLAARVRAPAVLRAGIVAGAAAVVVVALAAVALPGIHIWRLTNRLPRDHQPADIVAYIEATQPHVPVVIVMDPPRQRQIVLWKWWLNEARAFAPRGTIASIVPYFGSPQRAVAGLSTPPQPGGSERLVARTASQLWRSFGDQVRDPSSIVLVPRQYVSHKSWNTTAHDPGAIVTANLAVARGPRITLASPRPQPSRSAGSSWLAVVLSLLVLWIAGAGFAATAARRRGGSWFDAASLAPAMGMVVLILTGLAVSFVGGDPTGPAGPVAAGVVALIGIGMAAAGEGRLPQWARFAGRSRLEREKQSEP